MRFITGVEGNRDTAANVEIKCFDAAANPYLAVAALLCAGRAGLAERASLPEPVEVDPASLDPDDRAARGIAALPASLDEAVAAMEAEPVLAEALGEVLVDTVAAVRRGEIAKLAGASPEEIAAATRWRY
jgi:glutamine synthetase